MTFSKLTDYKNITNKRSSRNGNKITKIVIHHMAGVMSGKACADYFTNTSREVSANYCIGNNGDIALNVPEEYRRWTTADYGIDSKAITIEVSNSSTGEPWLVSNKAMTSLIKLVADIGYRYDLYPITYTGDKKGTLHKHKWYSDTTCPGTYLSSKFRYIAKEANKIIEEKKGIGKKTKIDTKPPSIFKNIGDKKNIYIYEKDGKRQKGFVEYKDKKYYFRENGTLVYGGFYEIDGATYYFKPYTGEMVTGWQRIKNKIYYFRPSGSMVTLWQKIDGKWHFFTEKGTYAFTANNLKKHDLKELKED